MPGLLQLPSLNSLPEEILSATNLNPTIPAVVEPPFPYGKGSMTLIPPGSVIDMQK